MLQLDADFSPKHWKIEEFKKDQFMKQFSEKLFSGVL